MARPFIVVCTWVAKAAPAEIPDTVILSESTLYRLRLSWARQVEKRSPRQRLNLKTNITMGSSESTYWRLNESDEHYDCSIYIQYMYVCMHISARLLLTLIKTHIECVRYEISSVCCMIQNYILYLISSTCSAGNIRTYWCYCVGKDSTGSIDFLTEI